MASWCANPQAFEMETLTCIQGLMDTETNCTYPKELALGTCASITDCNACNAAVTCKM